MMKKHKHLLIGIIIIQEKTMNDSEKLKYIFFNNQSKLK